MRYVGWQDRWTEDLENPLNIDAGNIDHEAVANLMYFGITTEEAAVTRPEDIILFVNQVVEKRAAQLLRHDEGPVMVCYWWVDEMAAQLRCSLVSRNHGTLPFGVDLEHVPLEALVRRFLDLPHLDGIPWSELKPISPDEDLASDPETPLMIWTTEIPV